MKELSLNILDVAKNSVTANASLIKILINETEETLEIKIIDDGCGMDEETVMHVVDPFYTTRTTRSVGLGIPLFKLEAEQTGGSLTVESRSIKEDLENHGTEITALFYKNHIDFIELGDIVSTVTTLISGSPEIDFLFEHKTVNGLVSLDTSQIREVLGADVPLDSPEIIVWMTDSLKEEYERIDF